MQRVFLLSACLLALASASPCDDGWRYFPGSNSCYKLITDILPWTVAEFKCLFQGAHHVAINSWEENQFVNEVARHSEIWTGAAYFGRVAEYVNSDQSTFGLFENWTTGSRPSMNKARRCIKMDKDGSWFQSCCKKKTFTVCEKPAAVVPSWMDNNDVDSDFARRHKFVRRRL